MRIRAHVSAASAVRRPCLTTVPKRSWLTAAWPINNRLASSQASPAPYSEKPFYVTTPIFYVNAAPHVGHLYTVIIADVIKRWQQLKGRKALLATGTDEHGLKVQKASEQAGMDPKLFCDRGAAIFKELTEKADVSNDYFVRTTDRNHRDGVQYAWHLLHEKGHIYMSTHEGWYSMRDEAFYPNKAVQLYLDPPTGRKLMVSTETGSPVEMCTEKNYHFRLSAFREPLLDFYKNNPNWITPESRMKEVIEEVESGLEDLSISRPSSRLTWGIPVPHDHTQTIYVWLDALMNYATKAGYPWSPGSEHSGGWPADVHVIGKDIVRFHCIYWPAFLMALGLPLPKNILTHAHWTLGKSKMSKSTGKVVDPFQALDRFSPDVMRFFLTHDGGFQDDADYDNSRIIHMYKKFLQAALGNLASRLTRGKKWSVRGAIERVGKLPPEAYEDGPGSRFYQNTLLKRPETIQALLDAHDPRRAAQEIAEMVRSVNSYFSMSSPWEKALDFGERNPGDEVDKIIYLTAESLRIIGIFLQPYMPTKAKLLLDQLGVQPSRRTAAYCQPGADLDYGEPMVELGSGKVGLLFPPLACED
ncbi:methionyl-tRNA synthetase-like protein [Sporormia fimetaria CBS 119925]|uniref:Probable methionine--tRNA ligase, mitochondrial n=1 Tax=Sporormia fimetaria CBS 119925 TaxID=1340428 RepID=A0A6A6VIV3_9PLEO|nr:methionyl-tRNA synthetase-like protein [Sporormia fimetaria CBS 119925]